jgi:hypothetical protein
MEIVVLLLLVVGAVTQVALLGSVMKKGGNEDAANN